jgi:hypothetical protein
MRRIQKLGCFHHVKWNPAVRDLRQFALAMLGGFGILGAVAAFRAGTFSGGTIPAASIVLWSLGALLALSALAPRLGRIAYLAVYLFSGVAGWVVSHVLLVVLFYLVFTPVGLLMRLTGADPLRLRTDGSMWREARAAGADVNYQRQF